MASIEPGMLLQVDCVNSFGITFQHDGIVTGVEESDNADKIMVIHYAWLESAEKRVISKTSLSDFLKLGRNPRVSTAMSEFKPQQIVKRANSQLGRADYLLGRNCQHFAHWCYHGTAFSREVFRYSVFGTAFGLVIAAVGIIGMNVARGAMW
jgi:hypothetical protein